MSSRPRTTQDWPGLDERHIIRPSGGRAVLGLAGQVFALAALVAFLVAVPTALWLLGQNPLPTKWEPARWWEVARRGFVHPDVIPNALLTACWICWAQIVLSLARETAARIRRGAAATRSALVLPPMQQLACRWIAVAWLGVAATTRPDLTESLPDFIKAPPSAAAIDPIPPTDVTAGPARVADGALTPIAGRSASPQRYVCERYDTLRSLAADFYGDANRWAAIRDASVGSPQRDGTRLPTGFVGVREGTILSIPAADNVTGARPGVRQVAESRPLTSPARHARLSPMKSRHVVRAGDTLWDIADASYPDARSRDLPEIVDAVFSANRGVTDGHGHVLHDPDLIHPGMVLRLPRLGPPPGDEPAGTTIQPRHSEPTSPSSPDGDQPAAPPVDGASETPPPGAATPSEDTRIPQQGRPTPPQAARPSGDATSEPTGVAPDDEPDFWVAPPPAPVWVGTATLLVTAFVAVSRWTRRRRDSRVRSGQEVPPPNPELVRFHTALLNADNPDAITRLDAALRTLAAAHRSGDQAGKGRRRAASRATSTRPTPQLILRHSDGDIEVLLREACDVVADPWLKTEKDARIWLLPAATPIPPQVGQDLPHPCPALVQVGTTADGSEVYLDLEAIGVLRLDVAGQEDDSPETIDSATMKGFARAVTATLAVSHLASVPSVRTCGFDPFGLANEKRVFAENSVDDLVAHAERDVAFVRHWLGNTGLTSTLALRAAQPSDTWDPTIAVIAGLVSDEAAERLTSLVDGGGRGLAVVLPPGTAVPTPWRLVLREVPDGEEANALWLLEPVGIELTPLTVAIDELRDLTALLAEAAAPPRPVAVPRVDQTAGVGPADAEVGAVPVEASAPEAVQSTAADRDHTFCDPPWEVMVRLLGPLDIVGRDGRPPASRVRGRSLEALAWLVTHRREAARADLEAALWPSGAEPGTITNVLIGARRGLEQLAGEDARNWIPARPISIDPAVVSDLEIVEGRLRYARHHRKDPDEAISALRGALRFIRGAPTHYEWLDAELGSTLTTVPIRAVELLAELCLDQGDGEGVLDATAVGLGLVPAHTGLVALRMRARSMAGDRPGVRVEYEAYARAERANPLTDGEVDPELERLFMDLMRNPRAGSASGQGGEAAGDPQADC